MRIAIDLQGAQTSDSRFRGIGRYSLSLTKEIVKNNNGHQIFLLLNAAFADAAIQLKREFRHLLPADRIKIWFPPQQVSYISPDNEIRRQTAEKIREQLISEINPDFVLITSLFEGLSDDAIHTICHADNRKYQVASIVYDLIPYIQKDIYLENPVVRSWYMSMLEQLKNADLKLSISDSARQECLEYLSQPEKNVVNISTAADPQFKKISLPPEYANQLKQRHGIQGDFVMYTGGIDYRKNIEGLIEAYAMLPINLRSSYPLAIVCKVEPSERAKLRSYCASLKLSEEQVIFTGFVSEEDLIGLYNICHVFIFPSKHEGFGLPALEAMLCGAPVIASNTSSLPEVIGLKEALFNPEKPKEIADILQRAISDNSFRKHLLANGESQSIKFGWSNTAKAAIYAMENHTRNTPSLQNEKVMENAKTAKLLLALVTPLPPEKTGIADYCAELIPALSEYYDIDAVSDQSTFDNSIVGLNAVISSQRFKQTYRKYDRVLYHFGNSSYHENMFELLNECPGAVVLHDFYLSGVQAYKEYSHGRSGYWESALYESHGYPAIQETMVNWTGYEQGIFTFPMNRKVLCNALGVIVHSEFSKQLARQWYLPNLSNDWRIIKHLRVSSKETEAEKEKKKKCFRDELGFSESDFLVSSFGFIGKTKMSDTLLQAWLNSNLGKSGQGRLVFVGANSKDEFGLTLQKSIEKSKMSDRVSITGWVDNELFKKYLVCSDMAIQLRSLTRGETSGTVLDCMNHALPIIVNANGSMAELNPESVCILPDSFTEVELTQAIDRVWQDSDYRKHLAEEAKKDIDVAHTPKACTFQYREAIEFFYEKNIKGLSTAIETIGYSLNDKASEFDLITISEALRDTWPQTLGYSQILLDAPNIPYEEKHSIYLKFWNKIKIHEKPQQRFEPIVWDEQSDRYFYDTEQFCHMIGHHTSKLINQAIDCTHGDILYIVENDSGIINDHKKKALDTMMAKGVEIVHINKSEVERIEILKG